MATQSRQKRKPGRKALPADEKRLAMAARFPPEVHAALCAEAERRGMRPSEVLAEAAVVGLPIISKKVT